jgi:acetyl-CoA carboxylase biotin carboxyl carrier protein
MSIKKKASQKHSLDTNPPNPMNLQPKEIQDLIDFIAGTGLAEVNIETEKFKLSIKRNADVVMSNAPVQVAAPLAAAPLAAAPLAAAPLAAAPLAAATPSVAPAAEKAPAADESQYVAVKSPMIGTFYRASSPEAEPFVKVGSRIEKGKPICIIEAMKLFNEIESDVSGTVVKVLVENASPVEYDQVLFLVDPA